MVKVHVRVRPCESEGFWAAPDTSVVEVTREGRCHSFKVDSVLTNASQQDVYDAIGKTAVQDVLAGFNASVIAYGQSASGKSYTLAGIEGDFERRGLVPRAISDLFASIAAKAAEMSVVVRVSAVELRASDTIHDLLSAAGDLEIFSDTVRGARSEICSSEQEVLTLWFLSQGRRLVDSARAGSHRAHGIFSLTLEIRNRTDLSGRTNIAKLEFADLAGGEKATVDFLAREVAGINRSLSLLEQVVVAASRRDAHVPYRSSRLTQVLREAIGGRAKTALLICLDPRNISSTLAALRFGAKATRVENSERTTEILTDAQIIRNLQNETHQLKRELQLHDHLAGRTPAGLGNYDALTPEDIRDLQVTVEQFLSGSLETIEVLSLRQVQETFAIFRKLFRKFPDTSDARADPKAGSAAKDGAEKSRNESLKTDDPANNIAPDDLRPPNVLVSSENGASDVDKTGADGNANPFSALALYATLTAKNERLRKANAQTAFEQFLASETEIKKEYEQLLGQLKDRRRTLRETQLKCNELKLEVAKTSEADVATLKSAHRGTVELVSLLKCEIEAIGNSVDQLKLQVISRFNDWYSRGEFETPIPPELQKKVASENDTVFRKSLNKAKILHSQLKMSAPNN